MRQAEIGISDMRRNVDTMIIVPNERLLAVVGKSVPFQDALKKADEVLLHATQGISSLISVTGLVNVDFADVRTVMERGGSALMGTGIGRGENRAMEAAQQAISSPLLDNVSIAGAMGVLVNITGGIDLTLGEVHQINEIIHDAVGDEAEIIFGAVHEPAMQGEIRVTVIATGFDRESGTGTSPAIQSYDPAAPSPAKGIPVLPFPAPRVARGGGPPATRITPASDIARRLGQTAAQPPAPEKPKESAREDLSDMEIPTFIRRQMD
jgi:cell division protein FtsZ